jgi:SAM-dependent methyltransferase
MTPPPCPVCRGAAAEPWFRDGRHLLRRCPRCALVWLDPLPSAEVTAALYGDPYNGATEGYFAKVETKMRRARGRARRLARAAGSAGRFLDIGCSGGFMVEAMRREGFEAHGLDLDRFAIGWAARRWPACRFYNEPVEGFAARGLVFDAIYCSEVIEHVPDPHGFVAAIAGLLRPGGLAYITTPDISHWRRPKDLFAEHGLNLYERRLAFKPGIKRIFRLTTF